MRSLFLTLTLASLGCLLTPTAKAQMFLYKPGLSPGCTSSLLVPPYTAWSFPCIVVDQAAWGSPFLLGPPIIASQVSSGICKLGAVTWGDWDWSSADIEADVYLAAGSQLQEGWEICLASGACTSSGTINVPC